MEDALVQAADEGRSSLR